MSENVVVTSGKSPFAQDISIRPHQLKADEPVGAGGEDAGPNPYELLLAALGASTGMTLRMYTAGKGWPLRRVQVRLRHEKVYAEHGAESKSKEERVDLIKREILLIGELSHEQRQRLLEIADRCPVHRTLTSQVRIESQVEQSSVQCGAGSQ